MNFRITLFTFFFLFRPLVEGGFLVSFMFLVLFYREYEVDLKRISRLKADRPHPRDNSTHRQTLWTDNDSSLLLLALGKADKAPLLRG